MSPSRNIFHPGNDSAVELLRAKLELICGAAFLRPFVYSGRTYDNVEAEIPGADPAEVVVVGAHLDSTAANDPGYDPEVSDAPGGDDDLSGVIGVIQVAQTLRELADTVKLPQRSIRFVLFNAEEYWLRGSWAYAHELKELEEAPGSPTVAAMIAMDMIGWHGSGAGPHPFEIHGAGTANTEFNNVAASSAVLTTALAQTAGVVAPNLVAQVYPLAGCTTDPATNRSDHSSFHYHDWPACLVSEDLWVDVCSVAGTGAPQQGNPFYHTKQDVLAHADLTYLADIARTVAATAWTLANP